MLYTSLIIKHRQIIQYFRQSIIFYENIYNATIRYTIARENTHDCPIMTASESSDSITVNTRVKVELESGQCRNNGRWPRSACLYLRRYGTVRNASYANWTNLTPSRQPLRQWTASIWRKRATTYYSTIWGKNKNKISLYFEIHFHFYFLSKFIRLPTFEN